LLALFSFSDQFLDSAFFWGNLQMGFAATTSLWGAYPGNPLHAIGSGNCYVHNTLLLENCEKAVVRFPWRQPVWPLWMPTHRNVEGVGAALLSYLARPSFATMNAAALQALRG
jgi:hypothetical protein